MIDIKCSDNRKVFNWHEEGIPFVSFDMLDKIGVPNLYTTRYSSLDCNTGMIEKGLRVALMKSEDVTEARQVIVANLGRLAEELGSDVAHIGVTNQLHTTNVVALEADGLGYWNCIEHNRPEVGIDGLITDVPNACLVVYGADCPPIYLVDAQHHAIGLVHAGWKGTLGCIPKVAIKMMEEKYGSKPSEMYAAIGPSICENCYEMGDEIFDMFSEQWSLEDAKILMKRHESGKYHLDLWTANRLTLERAGIPADHIAVTNICTCCNTDTFYSYRAHAMENEQAAMLVNSGVK